MESLPIAFGIILPLNPRCKNSTNAQINLGTLHENKIAKVCSIKILLDNGSSTLIVHKEIL